ncbi:MAG TPA: hypothetical protein P5525_12570 [Candidatus Paceibacterota bacterium]|nr:hypothetical protein [Candidatus Paceibacterota bacterium]
MLRQATARYRTDAPSLLRSTGSRDEVLAAYLDALRQVPARTNFALANLSLLNSLVTRAQAPIEEPQADMIHSGSQRLLGSEGEWVKRQALLDVCTARAWRNALFRTAMDALLWPETLVSLDASPSEIIATTNSPLCANPTMTNLLALSLASGDGSLTVSSNQLVNLFSGETQTFWDTIHTNLALQLEINRREPDLLAYLTNQPALETDAQRIAAVQQGQSRKIAAATAAVLVQSKLLEAKDPLIKLPGQMQGVVQGLHMMTDGLAAFAEKDATKLARIAASGNMLAGGLELLDLFAGGESPEEEIAREIGNIKTLIGDLSTNMNYRFDRVDQSLTQIFDTLNARFDQIEITLDAQGRQIARLVGDVGQIRHSLLDIQTDLVRLERNLATFHALDWRFDLLENMNLALGYEARVGTPLAYDLYNPSYVGIENVFYTHAYNRAASETLARCETLPFSDADLYYQISPAGATNVYAETLNYLKKCLRERLGRQEFQAQPVLVNPQDWSAGAGAWLQLALENPGWFRKYERSMGYPSRLEGLISKGRDLTDFVRNLTFSGTGTNINRSLYGALLTNYSAKLDRFVSQVQTTEQQCADQLLSRFPLETWRDWATSAPRVSTARTTLLPVPLDDVVTVVAGGWHSLALKRDGTVVGWGMNFSGQAAVPSGLTNAVAISAGEKHSLALRADGTILAWGFDSQGEASVPSGLTNAMAIAAGATNSLAVIADGTVVAWGDNSLGQTNVPTGLSNVVAVASGYGQCLALRADGTVAGWGRNESGQANGALAGSNVVAIAAGGNFSLALKESGTVVPLGAIGVPGGLSGVVAIAADFEHALALKTDGTVAAWGNDPWGQASIPVGLDGVAAIAAGKAHSLALKTDGTIMGWGANYDGQAVAPSGTPPKGAVAIFAGSHHSLALIANGTVLGWGAGSPGSPGYGQATVPFGVRNMVALAAGSIHSLALKADGTIVGWGAGTPGTSGHPHYGQATPPSGLHDVVAIAAGVWHSLALKADGTVMGWGANDSGRATGVAGGPPGPVTINGQPLNGVVAIAAGGDHSLALKTDGTVVGWGYNAWSQATGVENGPPGPVTISGQPLNGVVAIAAGASSYHSLALKADGTVVGWGDNSSGQTTMPAAENGDVVAIAAGNDHSLALKADGTVVGWGNNYRGATTMPAAWNHDVVAIAAGNDDSLALKADGTVVGWGVNSSGQTTVPAVLFEWQGPVAFVNSTVLTATNTVSSQPAGRLFGGPYWTTGAPALGSHANSAALSFDGVSDYVAATIPALASDYTVSAWVFLRAGGTYEGLRAAVLSATECSTSAEVLIHSAPGVSAPQYLELGRCGEFNGVLGTIPVPLNQWTHIAVCVSPSRQVSYFIDGVTAGSWDATGRNVTIGPSVTLGDNSARFFDGLLDEVQIWARACSQAEIAANMTNRLSGTEPGLVAHWSFDDGPGPGISQLAAEATRIVAGDAHGLALRRDGTVFAWGVNRLGQCQVPAGLSNVVDVAAGQAHNLALRHDGSVAAWGWNVCGQATVPADALKDVAAIAAGGGHSVALKNDGTVRAWGRNDARQTSVPAGLNNVVAVAGGGQHSLALKADGSVVAWGANTAGQTSASWLSGVVAIAAGENHSLALLSTGEVKAWGWNGYGQTSVPEAARSGVVAISARKDHSLALKADGTVVAWGRNSDGQTDLPPGLGNVVALAAGGRHSVFLTAEGVTGGSGDNDLEFVLADVPALITKHWFKAVNTDLLAELAMSGDLNAKAVELSGSKALIQAVLELGMPYTLERDDVLHGFLYGAEALPDLEIARGLFSSETNRLSTLPDARPLMLEEVVWPRLSCFATRLDECLRDIQATGQPEIPRLVSHTSRLLNLLRDAWTTTPPPSLELWTETNSLWLVLFGEPYTPHTLQYSDRLNGPGWTATAITNLRNDEPWTPPVSGGSQRFYRTLLPLP